MKIFRFNRLSKTTNNAVLALLFSSALLSFNHVFAAPQSAKSSTPTKAQTQSADAAFKQGNALAEKRRYKEAGAQYDRALRVFPDDPSVLWNAGMAAYQSKDFKRSLTLWRRMKVVEPNNGAVRAKLIQAYQALSMYKELEAERKLIFALRKSGKDAELSKKDAYCRDQFQAGGHDVFAYELFNFSGERAVRYRFLVLKPDGTTDYVVSLGSYQSTTDMAREMGTISAKQRLYHLDGYFDGGRLHKTYAFYTREPTYNEVKLAVSRVVNGQQTPMSSSQRP